VVETEYPQDGLVRIHVKAEVEKPWALSLRIPAWAAGAAVVLRPVDGTETEQPAPVGTVTIRRAFAAGDVIELWLPMAPRLSAPDPRIDAVRGCLVAERGPLVHCLESLDLATASGGRMTDVGEVRLDAATPLRMVHGSVVARLVPTEFADRPWPYDSLSHHDLSHDGLSHDGLSYDGASPRPERTGPPVDVPLVPYYDWAERGPSTMRVWLPIAD
jgi:DUF1680 family protein